METPQAQIAGQALIAAQQTIKALNLPKVSGVVAGLGIKMGEVGRPLFTDIIKATTGTGLSGLPILGPTGALVTGEHICMSDMVDRLNATIANLHKPMMINHKPPTRKHS